MRRFWLVSIVPAAAAASVYIYNTRYHIQNTMSGKGATADPFAQLHVQKSGWGGTFKCDWGNFQNPATLDLLKWKTREKDLSDIPKNKEELDQLLPVLNVSKDKLKNPPADKVQVTWIGHATIVVQFDGISILSDPMFSTYAGLTQYGGIGGTVGYQRYRPAACKVEDIPHLDAVIISHDHYDHLDTDSVKAIVKCFPDVKWYGGAGMKAWLCRSKVGCKEENVTELEWWQGCCVSHTGDGLSQTTQIENQVSGESPTEGNFKFICVPAQHWCQRAVLDRNTRLWCGWVIIGPKHRYYFAGDTGYHDKLFKKIGEQYGEFDVAAIPIGAYRPRYIMEYQHVSPVEAVDVHIDVRSKQSVGIHWGTFSMANEFYLEPPNLLYETMEKKMRDPGAFVSLNLGETWTIGDLRDTPAFMGQKRAGGIDADEPSGKPQ